MKLLSLILSLLILFSFPIITENVHAQNMNQNVNENLTFYLENETNAHLINNLTTTYTFNTILGSRGSIDSSKHYIIEDWYLFPVLAGNLTIFNATFWVFIRFNGTDNNPNLYVNISERSPDGQEATIGSGSSHPILATSIESYEVKVPVGNVTIPTGYSIHIHFQLNGGTSTIYWIYYGNSTYASGISINTSTHLKIDNVTILNYNYVPTTGFNPQWKNKTMYIEAKISDPLGSYDVKNVSCYFANKSYTMNEIAGNPDSFYSIYEFKTNYSNLSSGNHTITVYALDYNGYYYYLNYYKYYYYLKSYETYFWVGLPISVNVSLFSSSGIPLKNATVDFYSNGASYENYTNDDGLTNIYLFSGTYSIIIYWNGTYLSKCMQIYENITNKSINGNIVNINRSISLKIYADVGNASLRIIDSENMPVYNALLYITFPNGEKLIFNTNQDGYIFLGLNPGGLYRIVVYYENVMVGNGTLNFSFNQSKTYESINVPVNIYHVNFHVVDSIGNGVQNAKLYMLSEFGIESFNSTNYLGYTNIVVPYGYYSITITWLGVTVNSSYLYVKNNSFIQANTRIFYLNLSVVDGENKTLENTYFSLNGNGITMLMQEKQNSTSIRLPAGIYNISTFWEGKNVNSTTLNLTGNMDLRLNASVYYLTINVYDNNKKLLNGTEIFVEENGSIIAYSSEPSAIFKIPSGNYTIFVKFTTEYFLTPVSLHTEKNITLNSNQEYNINMNYPPLIFETYLFYIIILFIIIIAVFSLLLMHKIK